MGFPLGQWIDDHSGLRFDLAQSGVGPTLRTVRGALRRLPSSDLDAFREELAGALGVEASRVFPTHGATEANGLVLQFLSRNDPGGTGPGFFHASTPEYPPLLDAAAALGWRRAPIGAPAAIAVNSSPNNPTGLLRTRDELDDWRATHRAVLVDETFREFSEAPSIAQEGHPDLWTTGSFTKVFGGDPWRVGFVVAPPEAVAGFDVFYGVLTDTLAAHSVRIARAVLRDRIRILEESRRRFRRNLDILRQEVDGVSSLDAPIWFDRMDGHSDGMAIAEAGVRRQVLVCPGSFFGEPGGVRITLTRPGFGAALKAYLSFRPGENERHSR